MVRSSSSQLPGGRDSLPVIVAAVDVDELADDVAGVVGGEEDHDIRDVVGLGEAAGRIAAPSAASASSELPRRGIAVLVTPGATALTRMPCGVSSRAMPRVSPTMPSLLAM